MSDLLKQAQDAMGFGAKQSDGNGDGQSTSTDQTGGKKMSKKTMHKMSKSRSSSAGMKHTGPRGGMKMSKKTRSRSGAGLRRRPVYGGGMKMSKKSRSRSGAGWNAGNGEGGMKMSKKHMSKKHMSKSRGGSVMATAALPFGLLAVQKFFQTRKGRKDLKKMNKSVRKTARRIRRSI